MTPLHAVIARLEAATEGSRELDAEIVFALHPDIGPYEPLCAGDEPVFWHEPYRKRPAPQFTTSLDAALTLVPEGWWVTIELSKNVGASRSYCHATLYHDADTCDRDLVDDEPFTTKSHNAYSGALATCIAALRARAALAEKGEG